MSDPTLTDIDFKNEIALALTTLKLSRPVGETKKSQVRRALVWNGTRMDHARPGRSSVPMAKTGIPRTTRTILLRCRAQ